MKSHKLTTASALPVDALRQESHLVFEHFQKGRDDLRIELPATLILNFGKRGILRPRDFVGAVVGEGFEDIYDGHNATGERNLLASETVGVNEVVDELVPLINDGVTPAVEVIPKAASSSVSVPRTR